MVIAVSLIVDIFSNLMESSFTDLYVYLRLIILTLVYTDGFCTYICLK